ncbi:MAG: sugar ABC transporter ATP-binding protein [Microcella sp.]|uniref:sugar ABC transporter ATP-binding protein n=1 Tax=Microcella sp. TaxID=1913979 RepID=UPI003315FD2D
MLGENGAGKSTLVKILAGSYRPDAGEISFDGTSHAALDPILAKKAGIAMIFQEIADAPDLTVAENISLGRWPMRHGRVDWQEMRRTAREAMELLGGTDIDVDAPVRTLSIGQRQLLEIARNVSGSARILVLDEPTAALSSSEVDRLFATVERLKAAGVAMVYITHRLDEVTRIGDRVEVLRDGYLTLNEPVSAVDRAMMVSAMIGREAGDVERPRDNPDFGEIAIEAESLTSGSVFSDVTFTCREGEVLALYGKIGSGTAESAEAIFGLRGLVTGSIRLYGAETTAQSPFTAVRAGLGFLPADRKREGIFAARSAAENLAAPSWPLMAKWWFLSTAREFAAFLRWRTDLKIKSTESPGQLISTLSGGNQQKVLLARWFERQSKVLLLVEPTRGVDVGARADIYEILRKTAKADQRAVVIATSDGEEVVQVADRVIIMDRGRITSELVGDDITSGALALAVGN